MTIVMSPYKSATVMVHWISPHCTLWFKYSKYNKINIFVKYLVTRMSNNKINKALNSL